MKIMFYESSNDRVISHPNIIPDSKRPESAKAAHFSRVTSLRPNDIHATWPVRHRLQITPHLYKQKTCCLSTWSRKTRHGRILKLNGTCLCHCAWNTIYAGITWVALWRASYYVSIVTLAFLVNLELSNDLLCCITGMIHFCYCCWTLLT